MSLSRVGALRRRLLPGLVLAAVSVLLTLGLLEAFARVTHLGTGAFWEPHPLYGWRNIPGAAGWESCYGECEVYVRINSRGLRDREIPYERTPGVRRVLLLGDSMTAGMQVPLERTFAKVAEAQLGQRGQAWEVINAGVNAFGTDNELLFYRLEARKYQPDVVVLVVYLANDVYNNSRVLDLRTGGVSEKPYFVLTPEGELELKNFPAERADTLSIRIGSFLKKHFQLPRFLAQVLRLRSGVPPVLQPILRMFTGSRGAVEVEAEAAARARRSDICAPEYTPEIEEAWAVTRALIRQMRQEVEAHGAAFAVLALPAAPQVRPPADGQSWYCDRANQELVSFLEAEGIPYLDLLEPFRQEALGGAGPFYFERDFHMNEAGHALVGRLLSGFLWKLTEAAQVPVTDPGH